jgi:hypothetical protein
MNTYIDIIQADITNCQAQIRHLQHSTIECVSFASSGKIMITDKDRLQDVNADIERLGGLVGHNEAVLGKLEAVLQKAGVASIEDLDHTKAKTADRIEDSKIAINRIVATWLKVSPNYDLVSIREHPRVKPELARIEPQIPIAEARLKVLSIAMEEALAVAMHFKPSGVVETKPGLKAALVRFDMGAAF